MVIKGLVDEDIANYKKTSMFIVTSKCSLKCDLENNCNLCQNSKLMSEPNISIDCEALYKRYINNPMTSSIVIGGLEPFDTKEDLLNLLYCFRIQNECTDDIIIYTGYTEEELNNTLPELEKYFPLIIKYGRFRPNEEPHEDPILGVELANHGQYAKLYTRN